MVPEKSPGKPRSFTSARTAKPLVNHLSPRRRSAELPVRHIVALRN